MVAFIRDITERKRVQEALRESEETARALLNAPTDVAALVDTSGLIVSINEAMAQRFGRPVDELIGMNGWELVPPDVAEHRIARFDQAVQSGEPVHFEDERDGTWFDNVFYPVLNEQRQVTKIALLARDITERKQMEEAARESEERYHAIFERAPDSIVLVDTETGALVEFNDRTYESLGYTREEFEKLKIPDFEAIESVEEVAKHIERTTREGTDTFETKHRKKDGEIRDILVSSRALSIGGRDFLQGVWRDITERKRAEEALRDSRHMLQTVLDSIPSAVFWKDRDSIYLGGNRTLLEAAGLKSSEEVVGKSDYDLPWEKEQADSFREDDRRVMESGIPEYDIIEPYLRADGTHAWARTNKVPLRDAEGNVVGVLGTYEDITERKQMEEAARESGERYHAIFEQAPDSIVLVDTETGALVEFNDRAHESLGYTREEFEKLKIPDFEVIESADEVAKHIERITREGTDIFETKHRKKDGEIRDILVSGKALSIGGRGYLQSIWSDITELKRAEEALELRVEQLAALSRASQVVTASLELDQVLAEIVSLAGRVVASDYTSMVLVDEAGNAGRSTENLLGIPGIDYRIRDKGLTRWIARSRQAVIIDEIGEDGAMIPDLGEGAPRFVNPPIVEAGVKSAAGLPLMVKDRLLGVLHLHSLSPGAFHSQLPLLTAFANQVAIAIENARLYEQLRAGREQLRDLAGYLQAAREEERTRIAREIHDEFGQALTALKMDLAWLTKRLPAGKLSLAEKASVMSGLIDDTIQTVRHVATELRPGLLDDLGLAAAIEWQAQEFAERTEIACELLVSDEEIALNRDLATAVFRILQETLTNVARHAGATEVRVELEVNPDELVLVVRDNGEGITESQASDSGSLGLIGMRERARSWGGNVTFEGAPGQGTTVTVCMPRSNPEESQK